MLNMLRLLLVGAVALLSICAWEAPHDRRRLYYVWWITRAVRKGAT